MNAKAADFNGDGLDDFIALNFTSSSTNQGPDAVEVSLNTTPGFSLQASSSSQQIQPGGSATYTINVGQQNGFSNPVALGCSAPAGVHCSLSSASVRPGNSITMMVTTTANSASAVSILAPFKFLYAFYMPLGGLVSIGFAARGRKTRRISSVMLGGVIASRWGWQAAFGVVGVPGLVLALVYLKVRDYPTVGPYKTVKFNAGDWNELEITVRGAAAECKCNGEVIEMAMKVPAKGGIGLQAEAGKFEFRRIRVKELP